MTTVYDMNDVSLYRVRMDQKDYRWIAVAKDDNGAIELCRAIVRLEREGHIVQDVFAVSPNGVSVAMNLRGFKEFRQAEKEPETKVVDAMFRRYCASGAYLDSHCKADLCSHRVFDIEICGAIADDDEIGECDVVLRGEDGEEHEYEAILLDDEGECSLEPDGMVFEAIQKACKEHTLPNFFWECNDCDAKTLDALKGQLANATVIVATPGADLQEWQWRKLMPILEHAIEVTDSSVRAVVAAPFDLVAVDNDEHHTTKHKAKRSKGASKSSRNDDEQLSLF